MAYYSAPDDAPETPPADGAAPPDEGGDEQGMQGETTLIPKSILAGKDFKPGDEVVLKIVKLYDDQAEVEYAPEKGKDSGRAAMHGRMDKYAEADED